MIRTLGHAREHARERFWVAESGPARPLGYAVYQVSTAGQIIRSIRHEPDWWQLFPTERGRSTGPSSSVMAVRETAGGKILLLFAHAKAGWRRIPRSASGDRGKQFEIRMVALDGVTLRVVGSATVPGRVARFLSDSRLAVADYNDDSEVQLRVVGFRLP